MNATAMVATGRMPAAEGLQAIRRTTTKTTRWEIRRGGGQIWSTEMIFPVFGWIYLVADQTVESVASLTDGGDESTSQRESRA